MNKSIRVLLNRAVDYAGLFPPAELDMEASAWNYDEYGSGPHGWALGRFIVPVSRLEEFNLALTDIPVRPGGDGPWRLSVLVGPDLGGDLAQIGQFNKWHEGLGGGGRSAVIEAIEIKARSAEVIEFLAAEIPRELAVFFEIPIDKDPEEHVSVIARSGAGAKMRTGGVTRGMFPPASDVVRFIGACYREGISFKATAGLHHPIRSTHPLTYGPGSPSHVMNGFLNLFLAAAFIYDGMSDEEAIQVLMEESPDEFRFDDDGVQWRERCLLCDSLSIVRRDLSVSFGSSSFREPIEDLKGLRLL